MVRARDAYVEKMKAKLEEWNAEIAKIEVKALQKKADSRAAYQEQIDELKAQRREVKKELEVLSRSGAEAWEDLKSGVERASDSMVEAVQTAHGRFQQ